MIIRLMAPELIWRLTNDSVAVAVIAELTVDGAVHSFPFGVDDCGLALGGERTAFFLGLKCSD
jgi:hypothetical protein